MHSGISFLMDAPLLNGEPIGHMMRGGHPGGFLLGGLGTAVWSALIVLLVLWIAKNWSNPKNPIANFARRAASVIQPAPSAAGVTQTPLEILQTRYAKGEINREAYEMIRRDLTGEAPPASAPASEAPPVQA